MPAVYIIEICFYTYKHYIVNKADIMLFNVNRKAIFGISHQETINSQ
jgi:hypothetical protein